MSFGGVSLLSVVCKRDMPLVYWDVVVWIAITKNLWEDHLAHQVVLTMFPRLPIPLNVSKDVNKYDVNKPTTFPRVPIPLNTPHIEPVKWVVDSCNTEHYEGMISSKNECDDLFEKDGTCYEQGCGSGYFSTASAFASASTPSASASANKKREDDRWQFF